MMELKEYKVGSVCKLNAETIKSLGNNDEILYLETSDINNNTITGVQRLPYGEAPSRAQRTVRDKTIIISTVRPILRHMGILSNPADNMIVSTGFCTLDVQNEKIVDAHYIYYYLCQTGIINHLQAIAQNAVSSYPSINPSDIADLSITLPTIDEQKKIGKILTDIDRKIELNKAINANLEAMAKQLYDYWFVQFDFPDANGRPYKSSGGRMLYNPKLKREIPADWTNGVLSDIANITMGQSPNGESYNEDGNGMIFYQGSTDFGIRFPKIRQYTTEPSRFATKGDILMSVRAPVGAINIANNDCCIGRGLSAINSRTGSISHLYYVLDWLRVYFERQDAAGTTFGSINKNELHGLPIVVPPQYILNAYERMCKPIFNKQMRIGEEIDRLTTLRDSLLPMLMNGQVTVR